MRVVQLDCTHTSYPVKIDSVQIGEFPRHKTTAYRDCCLTEWHSDIALCKQLADEEHIPMIAVWSNKGCFHCNQLKIAFNSSVFKAFQRSMHIIWCMVTSTDADGTNLGVIKPSSYNPKPNEYAYCWIGGQIKNYPFVRFYWNRDGNGDVCESLARSTFNVAGTDIIGKLPIAKDKTTGEYTKAGNDAVQYVSSVLAAIGYQNDITDTEDVKSYSVTFKDYDGKVLKEESVYEGNSATPPTAPKRAGYQFLDWKPDFNNVQSDLTCVAQYVSQSKQYENPRYVSEINRDTTLFQYQP